MPDLSRRALFALVLMAASLVGVALTPSEVEALPPCPGFTAETSIQTGYGFTCTDATNDLRSKLQAEAAFDCLGGQASGGTLVITEECRAYSSTQVQVTGYLKYRCFFCL